MRRALRATLYVALRAIGLVAIGCGVTPFAWADDGDRLVLGSFADHDRAERWAVELASALPVSLDVVAFDAGGRTVYRTVTEPLPAERLRATAALAKAKGISAWRWIEPSASSQHEQLVAESTSAARVTNTESPIGAAAPAPHAVAAAPQVAVAAPSHASNEADGVRRDFDFDLGFQTRAFAESGADDQSSFDPSVSARAQYYRAWNDERSSVRAIPFVRYDAEDDRRTHADLRELQYTLVGDHAELHAGVRQVFWGVTEFEHLVDIINQTDLVEDIDGEEKLGQPMVDVSLEGGDCGVLDLYAMTGFRERTYPGDDGRLRFAVPVETSKARYQSDDREWHVDGAIRWSDHLGPVELGLYQFSGTSREPELIPTIKQNGKLVLIPYYPLIDQTGLDGQAIIGNWVWKLEALSRSGFGDRYQAATGGFEWTWVGAFATRSDVGFVLEYMWDSRGDEAQSVFEHDFGVATRWRFNDPADTAGLIGLVWDPYTHESIVKLEGSTRLSDTWSINVEGRIFSGARTPPRGPTAAVLAALLDPDNKTGSVQRDDFLSLELVRYF